jgi:hypothetical protein
MGAYLVNHSCFGRHDGHERAGKRGPHRCSNRILVFRRVGEGKNVSSLGQLAMTQLRADQPALAPIYGNAVGVAGYRVLRS